MADDTAAKAATPTEYVVLGLEPGDEPGLWRYLGKGKGVNATQAIKQLLGDDIVEGSTFVAIPARSWRPTSPTVKVERRVSWS